MRSLAAKYPGDRFALIGVSLDEDLDQLRRCVAEERLDWPHICEGGCWQDPLAKLYNITGIPQTYVVGRDGLIVAKDQLGDALEETLDEVSR